MTENLPQNWRPKLDASGSEIANCWVTLEGYTVSLTGRPGPLQVGVTRPGDAAPSAYTQMMYEAVAFIAVDVQYTCSVVSPEEFDQVVVA